MCHLESREHQRSLVQRWFDGNPRPMFNWAHFLSFSIFTLLQFIKLRGIKLLLIQTRFMKKYFQVYKESCWEALFDFYVNPGLSQRAFELPSLNVPKPTFKTIDNKRQAFYRIIYVNKFADILVLLLYSLRCPITQKTQASKGTMYQPVLASSIRKLCPY